MLNKTIIIAIDGHAASGKSTIGKKIADNIGGLFISTGEIYRLITYWLLQQNTNLANEEEIIQQFSKLTLTNQINNQQQIQFLCNGELIPNKLLHSDIISSNTSLIAQVATVRHKVLLFQRNFANLATKIIIEGRDIGTAIFPDSPHKFFITASPKIRAERRLKQYSNNFTQQQLEETTQKIIKRDAIDSSRQTNPTKQAKDAILIDTSNKSIKQVIEEITLCLNK